VKSVKKEKDVEKELGAAAWYRAIGLMTDEDYQKIKAECQKRQRQKEHLERKQNAKRIRSWRRIIARSVRKGTKSRKGFNNKRRQGKSDNL